MKKSTSPLPTLRKTWRDAVNPKGSERQQKTKKPRESTGTEDVTGVLLLAGRSSRMGTSKPLLTFGNQTLVSLMLGRMLDSDLTRIIVILGYQARAVKKEILKSPLPAKVKMVINQEYNKGLSTSIITALSHLESRTTGIMFLLGDQPLLTTAVINKLIKFFRSAAAPIVVPLYGKKPGNPVIFRTSLIPELQNLSGDMGGRELIKQYWNQVRTVPIRPQRIGWDMDTPEEYEKLKEFVT
jgi:molybdenum cofactor cytidylyltransferase